MVNQKGLLKMDASAGSGKTYNLARRYIELLLFKTNADDKLVARNVHNYHRRIVAITFTNKATDEMKQRIIKYLHEIATDTIDPTFLQYFQNECDPAAYSQIRSLAATALNEILFDYSQFAVSTIDSFFQSIVRTFAFELNRSYDYEVIIDSNFAINTAVHNMFLSLGKSNNKAATDWAIDVQRNRLAQADKSVSWKFMSDRGDMSKFAKVLNSELFRTKSEELRKYLTDQDGNFDNTKIKSFSNALQKAKKSIENNFLTKAANFANYLQGMGLTANDIKSNGPIRYLINYANNAQGIRPASASFLEKEDEAWLSGIKKSGIAKLNIAQQTDIANNCNELKKFYLLNEFIDATLKDIGWLGFMGMIDTELEKFRRENESILIADTNELIAKVIKGGVNFIFERTGTQIDHIMIDEFQDTSRQQYNNFKPLIEECLGRLGFAMLIGDGKQSIYRFRNADPQVFTEQVAIDFAANFSNETLPFNYRSDKRVVEFNNEFVKFLLARTNINSVLNTYKNAEQKPKKEEDKGLVRIITQIAADPDPDTPEEATDTKKDDNTDGINKREDVLEVLPKYLLQLRERFRWNEIGILVNTRVEGAMVVQTILKHNSQTDDQHRINIISNEALLVKNASVVQRLIAMLRLIDSAIDFNPQPTQDSRLDSELTPKELMQRRLMNQQKLYTIINTFAQQTNKNNSADDNGRLLVDIIDTTQPASMKDLLPDQQNEMLNLTAIVEHLIRTAITPADAQEEQACLLAFQDCVLDFSCRRNGSTLHEFLAFWDDNCDALAVPAPTGMDAINVMTIHKAKGLEFPCVVIPFANWGLNYSSRESSFWMEGDTFEKGMKALGVTLPDCPPVLQVNKSKMLPLDAQPFIDFLTEQQNALELDLINKTYVAFTRPKNEMHIFVVGKDDTSSESARVTVAGRLIAFVREKALVARQDASEKLTYYDWGCADDDRLKNIPAAAREPEKLQYGKPNKLDFEVVIEDGPTVATERGNLWHRLLSMIRVPDDAERAVTRCRLRGKLPERDGKEVTAAQVRALVQKHAEWFSGNDTVYTERSLINEREDVYRPDRIVVSADKVIVIDYKTGNVPNDATLRKYRNQVSNYMRLLRDAGYGDHAITGALWFIDADETIDVTL